jgi:hypothetical protein
MNLTIPANPAAGFTADASVRVAVVDGVKMVSVFDVIKLVIGPGSNQRQYWSTTVDRYPELKQGVKTHKFPGAGQRDTPIIDAKRVVMLLNMIPGKKAANFRMFSADVVVRYLGGDDTLVAEIEKNAEMQEGLADDDPMSLFGSEVKRNREDDAEWVAIKKANMAANTISLNVDSAERAVNLLERYETSGLDGPTKLLLKDVAKNLLASLSTRMIIDA